MAETEDKPKGRAITVEQRKKGQAERLASNLRANLRRRKVQARARAAGEQDKTAGEKPDKA